MEAVLNAGTLICEKCLFREMSDSEYFRYIRQFLDSMNPDDRVSEALYEARLAACRECSYLRGGMCRMCGCFVEIRAAAKIRHCPGVEARW